MPALDAIYDGDLDQVQVPALGGLVVRRGQSIQDAANELAKAIDGHNSDDPAAPDWAVIEVPVEDDAMAGLLIQPQWKPRGQAARDLLAAVLVATGTVPAPGDTTDEPDAATEAPAGAVEVPTTKRPPRARKE
jgi:hypothetical protein